MYNDIYLASVKLFTRVSYDVCVAGLGRIKQQGRLEHDHLFRRMPGRARAQGADAIALRQPQGDGCDDYI